MSDFPDHPRLAQAIQSVENSNGSLTRSPLWHGLLQEIAAALVEARRAAVRSAGGTQRGRLIAKPPA